LIAGCSAVDFRDIRKPAFQGTVSSKIDAAADQTKSNFIIRSGDSLVQSLSRLGQITGTIYIVDKDDDATRHVELTTQSQPITSWADMENYLAALGYVANLSPVGADVNDPVRQVSEAGDKNSDKPSCSSFPSAPPIGYIGEVPCSSSSVSVKAENTKSATKPLVRGGYMRVSVRKIEAGARVKASSSSCHVHLVGALPMGPVISDVCRASGVVCSYIDTGASAYTGVVYPMSFEGNCADALGYVGQKADLSVNFTDDQVEFKMMETATIDLGIPLRDRKVALDIIATTAGGNGNGATQGTTSSATTTEEGSASASSVGSGKTLQSGYQTNYFQSIRAVLESMRTPFGTWNYFPETGQIFIRDRAEAVAAVKNTLNRMAQTFQSRFSVTLTLYRVTMTDGIQSSSSLVKQINDKLSVAVGVGTAITSPQGVLTYNGDKTKSVINVLSSLGNIETLDSYTLSLQAGIPQTLKVAQNTEYVRNISTTSVATAGSVSSSVEQANATDGSFLTVQARQAEAGKIAIDYGVFSNQLEGFDTTTTETVAVKSQRGYERTFDTTSVVEDGVPYVATLVSSKNRNDTQSSIPGLDQLGFIGTLLGGDKTDSVTNSYIAVVVEAVRQ
jgi:hypothetical protein